MTGLIEGWLTWLMPRRFIYSEMGLSKFWRLRVYVWKPNGGLTNEPCWPGSPIIRSWNLRSWGPFSRASNYPRAQCARWLISSVIGLLPGCQIKPPSLRLSPLFCFFWCIESPPADSSKTSAIESFHMPSTFLPLLTLFFFFFEDSHPFLPFVSFLFFSFRECGACSSGYFFFLRFLLRGMPIAYLVQSPASNIFLLMRTPPSFFHLIYPQPLYEERPRRSSLWTFFFNFIFLRFFGLLLQLAPVPVACSYSYSHTASE